MVDNGGETGNNPLGKASMMEKEVILTAVTDPAELEVLKKQLGKEGYEVVTAADVPQLIDAIQKKGRISLAVVDVTAFDDNVWQQLEALDKSKIPFFVISPERGPSVQKEILKHGASGLFSKGLRIKDLLEYVHTLLGK
jgi:CheY-like chemotaxis protein